MISAWQRIFENTSLKSNKHQTWKSFAVLRSRELFEIFLPPPPGFTKATKEIWLPFLRPGKPSAKTGRKLAQPKWSLPRRRGAQHPEAGLNGQGMRNKHPRSRAVRAIYSKWRKSAWQNSIMFTYWSMLPQNRTVTPELPKIWLSALPNIMLEKYLTHPNSNRGKLKLPLHFHPKKKPTHLKHTWKRIAEDLSPTATFENYNPPRLKWVKTSKIAVFYNFYRFRGGLDPLSNPPQTQNQVCKTLYYPFLISANQCPHERNSFLWVQSRRPCRSQSRPQWGQWCFVRFRRISTFSLEYFTLSCWNPRTFCV